ncbi:MAG: hypothetical protein RIG77_15100 [Cyclobacteriaceae bacterium]
MNIIQTSVYRTCLILTAMLCLALVSHAHKGHEEKKDTTQVEETSQNKAYAEQPTTKAGHQDALEKHAHDETKVAADLADFPNLHPLIVHFAIVLLVVGAFLQVSNIYFLKTEIAWIAFGMVAGGVLTAYLAGRAFHPHTHGLTEHAQLVLEQHDFWADLTINFGIIGAVAQGVNLFVLNKKRWAVALVGLILSIVGFSVSQAGHYGSQLVHIEGVGPQGNYLESGDHHH